MKTLGAFLFVAGALICLGIPALHTTLHACWTLADPASMKRVKDRHDYEIALQARDHKLVLLAGVFLGSGVTMVIMAGSHKKKGVPPEST